MLKWEIIENNLTLGEITPWCPPLGGWGAIRSFSKLTYFLHIFLTFFCCNEKRIQSRKPVELYSSAECCLAKNGKFTANDDVFVEKKNGKKWAVAENKKDVFASA